MNSQYLCFLAVCLSAPVFLVLFMIYEFIADWWKHRREK